MDRIAIIGFGAYGASIGMGLKKAKLSNTEIVGSGRERRLLSTASKMGAIDRAIPSLASAVDGANLVVLDTSITETKELLEAIGAHAREGCVVTDLGTSKMLVMQWAQEYLPREVSYVGGHPLLKTSAIAIEDASASLFEGADYCVIPADSADRTSVRTVVHLAETLGAKPLFMDPREHDSYAVAMNYLPMLLSSAFVTATSGSEGWRDMHRLAASEFSLVSQLASTDPQDIESACLANPDDIVHWIDQLITELYSYRSQITEKSDNLLDTFIKAWEARARWEADAVVEEEDAKIPGAGESMATVFMGERLLRRYQEVTRGADKQRSPWTYFRRK